MNKINKELLENITILYVEDEEAIREEVEYFLSKYFKNMHVACNGQEGLDLYNEIKPDIIITDIQMPVMNGLEMIKAIDNKNVPVIITTAYSDIDFFLEAIELKVSKFVIKPMHLKEILLDVQTIVSNTNLKDRLFEKDKLLTIIDENVLISVTDKNGVIIDTSHAFCEFVGYSKDELIGSTHRILKHEDTPLEFYENMWKEINSGKVFITEIKNRKKSGEPYWANLTITPVFKDSEIVNFTAIRQDITDRKKLEQLAIHDDLTNLYNRRYFNKIIEKEIRRVKRVGSILSLVTIDVDYFKKYNDTYGHPKGDDILINIAKVISKHTSRASDYAFRMGGEEFGIIFSGLDEEKSLAYVQDILNDVESLKMEHKASKCNEYVTVSAGLFVQSAEALEDMETLYKYSDEALYLAKKRGRNQVVLSDHSR